MKNFLRNTLIAVALIAGLSPVIGQQFPTVPGQSVIGRLGTAGQSGPSQAIPIPTLLQRLLASVLPSTAVTPTPCANAIGDGATDDTAALNTCLSTYSNLVIQPGTYKITDKLVVKSNQTVTMSAGVTIKQVTVGKPAFQGQAIAGGGVGCDNVFLDFNGATLYGAGFWSATWNSNQGQQDRGVNFLGCTKSTISNAIIKNFGANGIAVVGGSSILIENPIIVGTNLTGTALPANANFQNGVYLSDDVTYGSADGIRIVAPDISQVAQGILRENQNASTLQLSTEVIGANIHDIPGQHAFYFETGKVYVTATLTNIYNGGFKVQSTSFSNQNISGFYADINGQNVGGNLFEVAVPSGTGSVSNLNLRGSVNGANGTMAVTTCMAIYGKVYGMLADVTCYNANAYGVLVQGANASDIDIRIKGNTIGLDCFYADATSVTNFRLRPTFRNCNNNQDTNNRSGIRVNSPSFNIELFDPDVTDTNAFTQYGLAIVQAGGTTRVRGSAKFVGSSLYAVQSSGSIIEWPIWYTLTAPSGSFTIPTNVLNSIPALTTFTSLLGSNTAAPATPASGLTSGWFDSIDLRFHDKNSAGTIGTTAVASTCAANTAFTAMNTAGAFTCAGITVTSVNGVSYPASYTSGGIPYASGATSIASSALLTANQIMIGGGAGIAPATLGSLGTTTTLLHGNAAGAPAFSAVVSADLNLTPTNCTNQFVSAISAAASGTCTSIVLAGAQFANQGTATTVLHGNAAGNPSFAPVTGADMSANTVGNAQIRQGAGLSVVGVTGSALANVADIAGTANQALVVNNAGTALAFGAVNLASSAAVTGVLPPANGGTGDAGTAWTAYTPTITAQSGVPTTTSATGRYKQIGKTVIAEMDITITAIGTATASLQATIPFTAAAFRYAGSCYEYTATGASGAGFIAPSGTFLSTRQAGGTTYWWTNGYTVTCTVTYEVP